MVDKRHGGPYDRGSADRYYGRAHTPHYFADRTWASARIEESDMTQQEISDYTLGYNQETERKVWK